MKKKEQNSTRAFALRIALALALTSISAILLASSLRPPAAGPQPDRPAPDVVAMVGPVSQHLDLRALPYIPVNGEEDEVRLTRHPFPLAGGTAHQPPSNPGEQFTQQLMQRVLPNMPSPIQTFAGMNSAQSGCGCLPPDTDGDVGPNHYIQSVNSSIKIFDKLGNALNGTNGTTYNSFFSGLGTGNPCGNNQNRGDGIVFYDHMADRWVVSDFAFGAFPGAGPFMQCIGVSKTSDPVAGGWWLYALRIDPANPTYFGDYPKFAVWNSGGSPAQNAYFLTVNLYSNSSTFTGVRAYALDRVSMLSGGLANAIAFTIPPAGLGASASLLAANFRNGSAPPMGEDEFLLAIDEAPGVGLTQVKGWRFHIDFGTPANSTLGQGANHSPNALIAVNAVVNIGERAVPQPFTSIKLDTLG